MAGRLDRCAVCDHFREQHDANGCRRASCECGGFKRRTVSYARSTGKGGRRHRAGAPDIGSQS